MLHFKDILILALSTLIAIGAYLIKGFLKDIRIMQRDIESLKQGIMPTSTLMRCPQWETCEDAIKCIRHSIPHEIYLDCQNTGSDLRHIKYLDRICPACIPIQERK